jgi:hypothetical protein
MNALVFSFKVNWISFGAFIVFPLQFHAVKPTARATHFNLQRNFSIIRNRCPSLPKDSIRFFLAYRLEGYKGAWLPVRPVNNLDVFPVAVVMDDSESMIRNAIFMPFNPSVGVFDGGRIIRRGVGCLVVYWPVELRTARAFHFD